MIAREAQLPLEEVRVCRFTVWYATLCYILVSWINIFLAGQAIIEWQAKEAAKYCMNMIVVFFRLRLDDPSSSFSRPFCIVQRDRESVSVYNPVRKVLAL